MGNPPTVLTITEDEPDPNFDLAEEEASTSSMSGNKENEELETLRVEIQGLKDQLAEAHRTILEQRSDMASAEVELQACKESKMRLLQTTSQEISRSSRIIGVFAQHQRKQS